MIASRNGADGPLKLSIELIPSPLHYHNLRSDAVGLGKARWAKLRKSLIAERGPACAICGDTENPHGHERWEFTEKGKSGTARLAGLEVICGRCHYIHHWGFTQRLVLEGKMRADSADALIQHFMSANRCARDDFDRHVKTSEAVWQRRNKLRWKVDWGEFSSLIKEARKGKRPVRTKSVDLKVPCANCSHPITITFPPMHSKSRKRLGVIYVCDLCKRGGRMELPPGSMSAVITKGARALFSADTESLEWKEEEGSSYSIER